MNTFYARTEEKRKISRFLKADRQGAMLMYGRRRVGKSELLKQCLKEYGKDSIYYECKETSEINNVNSLSSLIQEKYGLPQLGFQSVEEVLSFLFKEEKKLVLVLDEYPYLRTAVKGMDSILQSVLDEYRNTSSLKLIICGSYVDTMRSLLEENNPLYGRFDLSIYLKPMDYYDSAMFYDSFSDEDKVRLYSVFGGIPYYNRLIDPDLTVEENIIELIASSGARLENEVSMYLRSEISKITNANEVFEALSYGYSKYSDILSQSHVSSSPALADVLDKLIRMEMISKEAPINDPKNKKKTGYYITDNLSSFYYRYIFRYRSQMEVLDPSVFYDRYIRKDFEEQYVPHQFESVCRQFLIRENKQGKIEPAFDRIGKYYYDDPANKTNGEFDIVTEDPQGYIFYEAKFRKEPVTEKMIEEEIRQVDSTGLACRKYGFISRSGFAADERDNRILIPLSDLYL